MRTDTGGSNDNQRINIIREALKQADAAGDITLVAARSKVSESLLRRWVREPAAISELSITDIGALEYSLIPWESPSETP